MHCKSTTMIVLYAHAHVNPTILSIALPIGINSPLTAGKGKAACLFFSFFHNKETLDGLARPFFVPTSSVGYYQLF